MRKKYTFETDEDSPCLPWTEKQLSQVFLNLLKNAMQALEGHPHGELSLQAEQDEHIVIDITDNGPGIPPEILKNRFSGSAFFDSQMPFVAADNFFAQA